MPGPPFDQAPPTPRAPSESCNSPLRVASTSEPGPATDDPLCDAISGHDSASVYETSERIAVSVVSHGQADIVAWLLEDLAKYCAREPLTVLVTVNIPEPIPFSSEQYPFDVEIFHNAAPRGFSANHNAAFQRSSDRLFCVLNPDVRLTGNPFPALRRAVAKTSLGIAAPVVRTPLGTVADSARPVPTPRRLLVRYLFRRPGSCRQANNVPSLRPDWVAGMCMLMRSAVFRQLGGFDEKFYLYLEDVDLCLRARFSGYGVTVVPEAEVVHHAQRQSHRTLRYLVWHGSSLMRFYFSPVFLKYVWSSFRRDGR